MSIFFEHLTSDRKKRIWPFNGSPITYFEEQLEQPFRLPHFYAKLERYVEYSADNSEGSEVDSNANSTNKLSLLTNQLIWNEKFKLISVKIKRLHNGNKK